MLSVMGAFFVLVRNEKLKMQNKFDVILSLSKDDFIMGQKFVYPLSFCCVAQRVRSVIAIRQYRVNFMKLQKE
jgi:hypothetical protein